jgi:hypothetical protein
LRDDLVTYYTELKDQLNIKHSLLDSLYTGELEKINLLQTGNYKEAEDHFIDDEKTLSEIDSADFEISKITDNICRLRGIDKTQFQNLLKTESNPIIKEVMEIDGRINIKLKKLLGEKEKLISGLAGEMDELKNTIKTLSDIERIKKNNLN